jgi:ribonuclease P protein component
MATFKKAERLHKKKEVTFLFENGKGIHAENIKLVYAIFENSIEYEKTKALFVAPKRLFKRSPDRNLLKRRMREAFRLQKEPFKSLLNLPSEQSLLIGFLYKSKIILDYKIIADEVQFLLKQLGAKLAAKIKALEN